MHPDRHGDLHAHAAVAAIRLVARLRPAAQGAETCTVDKEGRQRLRSAVRAGNGEAILTALADRDVEDCPQAAGDALLLALARDGERAPALARRCLEALRERDWSGDVELADQLAQALEPTSGGAQSVLPVPVDLDDVVDALRGSDPFGGGQLNVRTGEVILNPPFDMFGLDPADDENDDEDEDESWLTIEPLGSRPGYRDMERFIATCCDARTVDQLTRAIDGKGAFRRFRITLESWPELENSWYRYDEERWRGRAREWLADAGYRPANDRSPSVGS